MCIFGKTLAATLCRRSATRIPESLFWADYAAHLHGGDGAPFLSNCLAHAGQTFTDAVAALAVTGKYEIAPRLPTSAITLRKSRLRGSNRNCSST